MAQETGDKKAGNSSNASDGTWRAMRRGWTMILLACALLAGASILGWWVIGVIAAAAVSFGGMVFALPHRSEAPPGTVLFMSALVLPLVAAILVTAAIETRLRPFGTARVPVAGLQANPQLGMRMTWPRPWWAGSRTWTRRIEVAPLVGRDQPAGELFGLWVVRNPRGAGNMLAWHLPTDETLEAPLTVQRDARSAIAAAVERHGLTLPERGPRLVVWVPDAADRLHRQRLHIGAIVLGALLLWAAMVLLDARRARRRSPAPPPG